MLNLKCLNEVFQAHWFSGYKQKFFFPQNFWNSWKQFWVAKMSWSVLQWTEAAPFLITLSCMSHPWDHLIALQPILHSEKVFKCSLNSFKDLLLFSIQACEDTGITPFGTEVTLLVFLTGLTGREWCSPSQVFNVPPHNFSRELPARIEKKKSSRTSLTLWL